FQNHQEMLAMIDAVNLGDVPWQSFTAKYLGNVPPENPPDWMLHEYTVFFWDPLSVIWRMILVCFIPHPHCTATMNSPRWQDIVSKDPETHGSMLVPLLLGSDKTLASNATGQNEFHPLYFLPGNV
ncbi:hypothetical protein BDM02DRAFT_3075076, partial [Thelephora ganbajun]